MYVIAIAHDSGVNSVGREDNPAQGILLHLYLLTLLMMFVMVVRVVMG